MSEVFCQNGINFGKLPPSSREAMRTATKQQDVRWPIGTKGKYGLIGSGLRLQHMCILGSVFLIAVGLLSKSYVESSSRLLMKIEILRTFDRGRPLEISEEGYILSASSTQNGMTSSDLAQDGEASVKQRIQIPESKIEKDKDVVSPLQAENPNGDGKPGKDGFSILLVNQNGSRQGEGNVITDMVEAHVNVSLIEPLVQQLIELVPEESQQERNTSEDKATEDSNQRQSKLPGEMIIQPSDTSEMKRNMSSSTGQCDVTVGKWVYDPAGPLYGFDQCSILTAAQNCQRNGRPDHEYESYKWQPDQCSLPRFDPNAFLELMRNKTLAFIGDSLARNQMESLMCILLQVANAKNKGRKDMHRWIFPSHNFVVIRMWSSWLVLPEGDLPSSIAPPDVHKLNLQELDTYAEHLPTFDVTILSSGHWWARKLAFFMEGKMLGAANWPWPSSSGVMEMDLKKGFKTAVSTALEKVGSYPGYKGLTILRTYTPDHYVGGSWDTGGSCTGETQPYSEGPRNNFNELMREQQLKAFEINTPRPPRGVMPNGSKLRLLDVYPVLNYRGDGHPGPYRNTDPNKRTTRDSKGRPPSQDCLHWCMPGPVDTMNELLFDLLRQEMQ